MLVDYVEEKKAAALTVSFRNLFHAPDYNLQHADSSPLISLTPTPTHAFCRHFCSQNTCCLTHIFVQQLPIIFFFFQLRWEPWSQGFTNLHDSVVVWHIHFFLSLVSGQLKNLTYSSSFLNNHKSWMFWLHPQHPKYKVVFLEGAIINSLQEEYD